MESLILTKREAVDKYGTQAQKDHFNKYRKFVNKGTEEALKKTLKQHYESVETIKQGRANVYKLGMELGYVADREDGRVNNGNTITLPYSNELNSLTIKYIINNCKDEMQQFSINTWLNVIGLVDREFTSAAFNNGKKKEVMDNLINTFDSRFSKEDIALLDNFILTERDRLTRNLTGLFNRLSKNKLIRMRITMFACYLNNEQKELSKEAEEKVVILKRELRGKHDVTPREIMFKHTTKKVIDYKKEESEGLKKLGYKFTYTSYGIILDVKEEELENYLNKLKEDGKLEFEIGLTEEMTNKTLGYFEDKYGKRATYYAEGRQSKNNESDNRHIKVLKKAQKYLPMYELLLIYFKLSRKDKSEVEFKTRELFGKLPF